MRSTHIGPDFEQYIPLDVNDGAVEREETLHPLHRLGAGVVSLATSEIWVQLGSMQ